MAFRVATALVLALAAGCSGKTPQPTGLTARRPLPLKQVRPSRDRFEGDFRARLRASDPSMRFVALVDLTEQLDLRAFARQLRKGSASKAETRAAVVHGLESVAARQQARLRPLLDRLVASGLVGNVHPVAVVNRVVVEGTADGLLAIGSSDEVARLFTAAGVPVKVSDNVHGELWVKLIVNCAYNAISAISRMPYGEMVTCEGIPALMDDVVSECLAVAEAAGIRVPGDVRATVPGIARAMGSQYSSTAQDLMRGKPSEIDHLNGYIVRKGQALGVPTPANRVLHSLVRLLESKAAS